VNCKLINGKQYVLCTWRQKFVRLTPEEWVRQHFLHYLVDTLLFPASRIAVEYPITVGGLQKRCDAVVFNDTLQAVCILEFKAATVAINQKVFDQVAVYNRPLNVPFFILSNGKTTIACKFLSDKYELLTQLPTYEQLCQNN